jgi:hypothetical protein
VQALRFGRSHADRMVELGRPRREAMEDMAAIFARALRDDLIGPSDF